jgi:hypothetical protein
MNRSWTLSIVVGVASAGCVAGKPADEPPKLGTSERNAITDFPEKVCGIKDFQGGPRHRFGSAANSKKVETAATNTLYENTKGGTGWLVAGSDTCNGTVKAGQGRLFFFTNNHVARGNTTSNDNATVAQAEDRRWDVFRQEYTDRNPLDDKNHFQQVALTGFSAGPRQTTMHPLNTTDLRAKVISRRQVSVNGDKGTIPDGITVAVGDVDYAFYYFDKATSDTIRTKFADPRAKIQQFVDGVTPANITPGLPVTDATPSTSDYIFITGHPDGRWLNVTFYDSGLTAVQTTLDSAWPTAPFNYQETNRVKPAAVPYDTTSVSYTGDTEPGNSGSPVCTDDTDTKAIALHKAGTTTGGCKNWATMMKNILYLKVGNYTGTGAGGDTGINTKTIKWVLDNGLPNTDGCPGGG